MPRRSPRHLPSLVLVLSLSVALSGAPARGLAPDRGSAGIGDSYFPVDGNGGIDVRRYRVVNRYEFGRGRLSGHTVVTLRATQDLSAFNLDFLLPVRQVRIDGQRVPHRRSSRHELTVEPMTALVAGEFVDVRVDYAGRPGRISWRGESNWLADRHEVVAMNQPHMAPWWFPANDHPRDKARMDISITVPAGRQVLANGRPVSRTRQGRLVTHRWRATEPMATYLATFAAGRFEVRTGVRDGLPWRIAVSKRLSAGSRRANLRLMRRTPRVVAALERVLGDYPFDTVGGLVTSLPVGFALENQTLPTYPETGAGYTWLVVHEVAHQWFGDSVSLRHWRDIWLNEGPATYLELWYDAQRGGGSPGSWLRREYESRPAGAAFWRTRIGDPGADGIFSGPVYLRGAMTFQALRNRIGTDAFWTLLRRWVREKRGGHGTREQFEALAEEVSGQNLEAFFVAWLDAAERPADTAVNGLG
ncbi:M1 family metallopeptidase [Nocardioides coralli]|uniref:M1 family metallopeptidase n=1 Tax=Nocardioides coralli TaxID=2872154 RepID=UPI001CA4390D|nr:M1 family metallopeptidase [Nocardioides coralli]QZY28108.1 M1 family metallopeptidase [Nocardioides coralli]